MTTINGPLNSLYDHTIILIIQTLMKIAYSLTVVTSSNQLMILINWSKPITKHEKNRRSSGLDFSKKPLFRLTWSHLALVQHIDLSQPYFTNTFLKHFDMNKSDVSTSYKFLLFPSSQNGVNTIFLEFSSNNKKSEATHVRVRSKRNLSSKEPTNNKRNK